MEEFLDAIPSAARSPYSLAAYAVASLLFLFAGAKLQALRQLLRRLEAFPKEERRRVIQTALNAVVPDSISAEEWLKVSRARWQVLLLGGLLIAGTTVTVIALTTRQVKPEEVVAPIEHAIEVSRDSVLKEVRGSLTLLEHELPHRKAAAASNIGATDYDFAVSQLKSSAEVLRTAAIGLRLSERALRAEVATLQPTLDDDAFESAVTRISQLFDPFNSDLKRVEAAWDDLDQDVGAARTAFLKGASGEPSLPDAAACSSAEAAAVTAMARFRGRLEEWDRSWSASIVSGRRAEQILKASAGKDRAGRRDGYQDMSGVFLESLKQKDVALGILAGPDWSADLNRAYELYRDVLKGCYGV